MQRFDDWRRRRVPVIAISVAILSTFWHGSIDGEVLGFGIRILNLFHNQLVVAVAWDRAGLQREAMAFRSSLRNIQHAFLAALIRFPS